MPGDDAVALRERVLALERSRNYDLRHHEPPARAVERAAAAAGLSALRARASLVRADVLCARGRRGAALDLVNRAALEAKVLDDRELQARVNYLHYVLHLDAGDQAGARRNALLSVQTLPDDAPSWLRAEHLLAVTVVLDTALDSVTEVFGELMDIARSLQDRPLELFTLNNMAWMALVAGDVREAVALVGRMRRLNTVHGLPLRSPDLDTIASIERADGRLEEALATIRLALSPEVAGDVHADHSVIVQLTAAAVLRDLGRTQEAEEELARARATALARDLPGSLADVEEAHAELCAAQGRWEQAYRAHVRHTAARAALRSQQDAFQALLAQAEFDARAARRDRDRYRRLANTDVLTSLPNRRAAQEHVETVLAAGAPTGTTLCLLDVDEFKNVNDSFSHDVGDLVLQAFAETLASACRRDPDLFAARLGGEEFVLVHTGERERAVRAAEEFRQEIARRDWSALCPGAPVTVSIGTVSTLEGPATFSALLSAADTRLYVAKRTGRNRVVTADGTTGQDGGVSGSHPLSPTSGRTTP